MHESTGAGPGLTALAGTNGEIRYEVSELTRGGGVVRTARFMASRVLALVEHPAEGSRGRAAGNGQP